MRFASILTLTFLAVAGTSGCGGDDTPPITGPVTLVVATEPHGGSFRAWFEELAVECQDYSQLTTTEPINIKLTGYTTKSRNEILGTLEGSYSRTPPTATMTLEIENHKEIKLRVDGLGDIVVKETTAGGKVITAEDTIAPGKRTFQVTAKLH